MIILKTLLLLLLLLLLLSLSLLVKGEKKYVVLFSFLPFFPLSNVLEDKNFGSVALSILCRKMLIKTNVCFFTFRLFDLVLSLIKHIEHRV
jgi:hypothetical protein